MNRLSEAEIIEGMRNHNNSVLKYIYVAGYEPVQHMVMNNSGTQDDAKDIFQEAMIIALKNIRSDKKFSLKCSFKTYLYSIARLLWLKHLRITRKMLKKEVYDYIDFEDPKPFTDEDMEYALYQKAFMELPDDCRKILKLSNEGKSQKEIASLLGYKSDNYISKRKHFCKEYLIKKIKGNPDFHSEGFQ